jgi:hypothetical protein
MEDKLPKTVVQRRGVSLLTAGIILAGLGSVGPLIEESGVLFALGFLGGLALVILALRAMCTGWVRHGLLVMAILLLASSVCWIAIVMGIILFSRGEM